MRLARCEKGHYYDKDKFSTCPHCNDMQIAPSETVAFEDPNAKKEEEVAVPQTPKVEVEERVLFSAATPVDEENKPIEEDTLSRTPSVTEDDLDEMVTIQLKEQDAVVSAAIMGEEKFDSALEEKPEEVTAPKEEEKPDEEVRETAPAVEEEEEITAPKEEEKFNGEVREAAPLAEEKEEEPEEITAMKEEEKLDEEVRTAAPPVEEKLEEAIVPMAEERQEEETVPKEEVITPKVEEKPEEEEAPVQEASEEATVASVMEEKSEPEVSSVMKEEPEIETSSVWEKSSIEEPAPVVEEKPEEESFVEEEEIAEESAPEEEAPAIEEAVAATAEANQAADESLQETLASAVSSRIPDDTIPEEMNSNPVIGWLIAIEGAHKGRSYDVKQGRNFVGRSTAMDICLSGNSKISRDRHAIITYDPRTRKCYLQPDESRDLVYINEDLLFGPMPMKHNDVITMGEERFVFLALQCDKADWI